MSKHSIPSVALPVLLGVLAGGLASFWCGIFLATLGTEDSFHSAIRRVEAVATDRGGVVESLHRNDNYSYSMTAVIRDDQFGRLEALLSDQSPDVTSEYVHSPSKQHDNHLRVGVDLRMTPERHSSEW